MTKPCPHPDFAAGCRVCYLARHDARYRAKWGIPGDPEPAPAGSEFRATAGTPPPGLGDEVEAMIKAVGADKLATLYERVTGRKCGCAGRKALLNKLPAVLPKIRRLLG